MKQKIPKEWEVVKAVFHRLAPVETANQKPIISAGSAINWYSGNFLLCPANTFRDETGYVVKARKLADDLRAELKSRKMTRKQFPDLMKERGVPRAFLSLPKTI